MSETKPNDAGPAREPPPHGPPPMPAAEPRLTSLSHGGGCGCKMAPGVLASILQQTPQLPLPPQLLVGIETADDAAVWQLDDERAIVATTDFFMPIVDDPRDFGRIAAANALSDVYAMGARPLMALAIAAMPLARLSSTTIGQILAGGAEVAASIGVPVAGGHTIDAVEPIYGLVALGLVEPRHLKRNCDARPGDVLVLGKPLGVGILSAALKKSMLEPADYGAMVASCVQLNTPGVALARLAGVHAMTDVTGFGLLGHLREMARGCGHRVALWSESVPWLDGVRERAAAGAVTGASARNWASYGQDVVLADGITPLDRALLCDPQTSGGLLVACAPEELPQVLAIFRADGFERAAVVGQVQPQPIADGPAIAVQCRQA